MSLVPIATLMHRGLLCAPWELLLALMHSRAHIGPQPGLLAPPQNSPWRPSPLECSLCCTWCSAGRSSSSCVFCSSSGVGVPGLVAPREGTLVVFLLFDNSFNLCMAVLNLHCFSVLFFQLQ